MYFASCLSDKGIKAIYKTHGPEHDIPETEEASKNVLAFMAEMKDRADYPEIERLIFGYAGVYEMHGFIAGFKAAIEISRWIMEERDGAELEEGCKRSILAYEAEQRAAKAKAS